MKRTILKLTISILVIAFAGMETQAQNNTGTTPYLGSTHTYTSAKTTGMNGTTMAWSVDDGGTVVAAADGLSAAITWTALGAHKVFVTETTAGPNSCSTQREFNVTVKANDFNLAVLDLVDDCGQGHGTVLADVAAPPQTTRTFTVNMTGDLTKSFTFDYAVTSPVSSAAVSSVVVKNADNVTINSGVSKNGLTVAAGKAPLKFIVLVDSRWNIQDDIKLTLTNATDFYGTQENSSSDNSDVTLIYALPKTSPITTDL